MLGWDGKPAPRLMLVWAGLAPPCRRGGGPSYERYARLEFSIFGLVLLGGGVAALVFRQSMAPMIPE